MTATLSRLRESARAARATPPAPPPGGDPERSGWSAGAHSVRFRVVAAMLLMMLAGLVVAGLITFAVQFQDSDARVDQALLDKAHAVVKLVPSNERSDRETLKRGLHEAAEDIEPRSNEVMAGITGGKVEWTVDGSPEENLLNEEMHAAAVALTGAADAAFGDFGAQGRHFRAAVVPVKGPPGPVTYLLVGRDTEDLEEHLVASVQNYVLVAAGTLLAAALLGGAVAGRLLYPLRRLREATQVVSPEDMTQRVEVRNGADDVTLLMKTFNTMLERLDEGAQQQQKFLDDAGHELRTPLTILRGHLELVSVDDPADVTATRDVLLEEVDRMQRLVDDLLLLANAGRPDFLRKQPVRFPDFLHQVMEKVHVLADRHWQLDETAGACWTRTRSGSPRHSCSWPPTRSNTPGRPPRSPSAAGLRVRRRRTACRCRTARRRRRLSGRGTAAPDPDTLVLWVRDTGTGIAAEDQQRIFERFGRAHPGRGNEGSGLGLAIVTAIAEAHGGNAGVESEYGHGSRFFIRIPLQPVGARL